jgi:Cytochrome b(C-terminal)/b6/petD
MAEEAQPTPERGTPPAAPAGPQSPPLPVRAADDKVYTWPYLTRNEFLCTIAVMAFLTVWSFGIDAPLEEIANPAKTPNPSKAPWYFLGLQEMLVYFDPWFAGVVLPTLIIVGLMAIPFVDVNTRGTGYYSFRERRFGILVYLFGFLVLWVALIILGVFFRGPGWNLFWPWQEWDPHKVAALTNVDLHALVGIRSALGAMIFGAVFVGGYFVVGGGLYYLARRSKIAEEGWVRFGVKAFLFLTMMLLPLKMILRLAFNIKYVWVTPWFNL